MLNLLIDNNINVAHSNVRHGFGLFETIRILDGVPLYLDAHVNRLAAGTCFLSMEPPPPWEEILEFLVAKTICSTLSSGVARLLAVDRSLHVMVCSWEPSIPKVVNIGISRTITRFSQSMLTRFKTISHMDNRLMMLEAERYGFYEVIAHNENGHITDGSKTNLFLAVNGRIITPPITDGALPGVTRGLLLEAKLADEDTVTIMDLEKAEAMMLTNALHKVIPVHNFYWRKKHKLDITHSMIMTAMNLIA
jgi:branched-chain amino acid aminotransferase